MAFSSYTVMLVYYIIRFTKSMLFPIRNSLTNDCFCRNKSNFISNPVYMQGIACEKGFEAGLAVGKPLLRNGSCLSTGMVCVGGRLEVCTRVINALPGHSRCKRERGGLAYRFGHVRQHFT